jgi:opacity protein-like surface antigen
MKQYNALALFILVISYNSVSYPQEISTGFFSGINISDIHGNNSGGKWKFKPGPVQGVSIDYSYNRVIGIQTGIDFSTLYYEYLTYYNKSSIYDDYPISSYYLPPPVYYNEKEMMNFSFLTIPFQFKISIPSKPQLNISAGIFYSFLQDYNLKYYNSTEPTKNDFGYIYSTGLSYPVTENLKTFINARYLTGRKEFIENQNYRHGSMDFTFGLAYNGFLKNQWNNQKPDTDIIHDKIYLTYKGGINFSWNLCKFHNKYSLNTGPSIGFSLNFRWGPKSSFQTGLSFERTGYSLRDSSDSYYRYIGDGAMNYFDNTKVGIDYIVIPALINFYIGKSGRFFFNTGPYLGLKLNARCSGVAFSESRNGGSYSLTKIVVYDDLEGVIKDNDVGWLVGGGVSVPFSDKLIFDFGLQYRGGLKDVFDRSDETGSNIPESKGTIIRNGSLALQIGLRIPVLK